MNIKRVISFIINLSRAWYDFRIRKGDSDSAKNKDVIFNIETVKHGLCGPRNFNNGRRGRLFSSVGHVISLRQFEEAKPINNGYNASHMVLIILHRFSSTN